MSHLTCHAHRRRSMVIRQSPKKGYDLGKVIHRNDGTTCEEPLVLVRGKLRTAAVIVLMRISVSELEKFSQEAGVTPAQLKKFAKAVTPVYDRFTHLSASFLENVRRVSEAYALVPEVLKEELANVRSYNAVYPDWREKETIDVIRPKKKYELHYLEEKPRNYRTIYGL